MVQGTVVKKCSEGKENIRQPKVCTAINKNTTVQWWTYNFECTLCTVILYSTDEHLTTVQTGIKPKFILHKIKHMFRHGKYRTFHSDNQVLASYEYDGCLIVHTILCFGWDYDTALKTGQTFPMVWSYSCTLWP